MKFNFDIVLLFTDFVIENNYKFSQHEMVYSASGHDNLKVVHVYTIDVYIYIYIHVLLLFFYSFRVPFLFEKLIRFYIIALCISTFRFYIIACFPFP